jgi:hypothetical protein
MTTCSAARATTPPTGPSGTGSSARCPPCGILHHIRDEEQPAELTRTLYAGLPPGSHVFIHHLLDSGEPGTAKVQAELQQGMGRGQFRTWDQIRGLFGGLELVEPGIVLVPDWRPGPDTPSAAEFPVLRLACAGVARKPVPDDRGDHSL